jgi:hypothetical protein
MSTVTRNDVMTVILRKIETMSFDRVINGVITWNLISNRLKLWSDVSSDQQPSAFLVTHRETDEYRGLGLVRRRLDLMVYCYARTDSEPGGPILDSMLEAFEATFNIIDNNSTGSNTLDGMVYFCRIEGRVFKDPGDLDNQAMMVVPIVVEMP